MSQQNNQNDFLLLYQKLDKLEEKLDRKLEKLDSRVDSMDKELAIYNEQLKIHIEGVILTREYIDVETTKLRRDIKPVIEHVNKIRTSLALAKKLSGWIVSGAAFVYLIFQLIGIR